MSKNFKSKFSIFKQQPYVYLIILFIFSQRYSTLRTRWTNDEKVWLILLSMCYENKHGTDWSNALKCVKFNHRSRDGVKTMLKK